jgi:protocatechuate 3,4-dioxygenase beta subunit
VEVWHADAGGRYSGADGTAGRFLRGQQRADASGVARFATIYPGWYPGRTPHIHLKVHVGGDEVHTGQIFFPDAVSRLVYRSAPYASRGPADQPNASDGIFRQAAGRSTLRMTRRAAGGYTGAITLGVRSG